MPRIAPPALALAPVLAVALVLVPLSLSAKPARVSLDRYVGAAPHERRGATSFIGDRRVRAAVQRHVPPALRAVLLGDAVSSPITRAPGGAILATMCEPHNCGWHSWAILIAADGSRAAVCHADQDQDAAAIWYRDGLPVATQDDPMCAGPGEELPAAVLALVARPAPPR